MGVNRDDVEWFRSSRWDDAIASAFEAKLRRARMSSRAQYLRIQAGHLVGQDDPQLREIGRGLLRRVIAEYGDSDALQALWATEDLAAALAVDGHEEEAEEVTRALLGRRDADLDGWRGGRLDLDLSLAELLFERGTLEALAEADEWLDRAEDSLEPHAFLRDLVLRHLVTRARVARARGHIDRSMDYASAALQVAAETMPSLPRHPDVGRPDPSGELLAELRDLERGA